MFEEGGHWYERDGTPRYEVPKKNGELRSVTLRDARKLLLVPSTTTVTKIVSKPAVVTYLQKEAIKATMNSKKIWGESDDEFIARMLKEASRHAEEASEEGTRIHDAIETKALGNTPPAEYAEQVAAARAELKRLFPEVDDWLTEVSFAHESGYGGKVDVHSPSTGILVDWKTKDGVLDKRMAYDQNIQLGSYQQGLLLPEAPCANIFISRTHRGQIASHVWPVEDVIYGREVFNATLELWKKIKKYDPSFTKCAK